MQVVQGLWELDASSFSAHQGGKKIWKNECAFTFESALSSSDGIFVNLKTAQAFSRKWVGADHERTGARAYLRINQVKVENEENEEKTDDKMETEEKPTKLAIGVEGGFDVSAAQEDDFDVATSYALVLYPDLDAGVPFEHPAGTPAGENWTLPPQAVTAANFIIAGEDETRKKAVESWSAENEERKVSKYAENLVQVDNGVKISPDPSTWKCADSGMTENLWLNLSTGYIGSGRRNWDGSGGTGAALRHFEETGKMYPLCVKLGTITAKGEADVFSYAEDECEMVKDPHLAKHLAHFGINIGSMVKTEKTIAEMEVDLNATYDWSKICEEGEELSPVSGPGFVGLRNLGNSCYVNSIVQTLFSLPPFAQAFGPSTAESTFRSAPSEPQSDLVCQLTKLGAAIAAGEPVSIKPAMFKAAAAGSHAEFKGGEQQDAREYFQHLAECISRAARTRDGAQDPAKLFQFVTEERIECLSSSKVKYAKAINNVLQLSIPLDQGSNAPAKRSKTESGSSAKSQEDEERVRVSFDACLQSTVGAPEVMDDYLSSATGKRGKASRKSLMLTFPKYLLVQLNRYIVGPDWRPVKIDCLVPVPEVLDMTHFRAPGGLQEGETALPDESSGESNASPSVVPDEMIVAQLVSMGFHPNGCARAAVATGNAGAEQAMEWVFAHSGDADFELPLDAAPAASSQTSASPESLMMLASMGFSEAHASFALGKCDWNLERAADFLFSHTGELDALIAAEASGGGSDAGNASDDKFSAIENANDGSGKYALRAIVSHLGKNTGCGHYVCHVKKSIDGISEPRWVLCNDAKIAESANPPFDLGYLYLFERQDE